jgi:hypothetical protein
MAAKNNDIMGGNTIDLSDSEPEFNEEDEARIAAEMAGDNNSTLVENPMEADEEEAEDKSMEDDKPKEDDKPEEDNKPEGDTNGDFETVRRNNRPSKRQRQAGSGYTPEAKGGRTEYLKVKKYTAKFVKGKAMEPSEAQAKAAKEAAEDRELRFHAKARSYLPGRGRGGGRGGGGLDRNNAPYPGRNNQTGNNQSNNTTSYSIPQYFKPHPPGNGEMDGAINAFDGKKNAYPGG